MRLSNWVWDPEVLLDEPDTDPCYCAWAKVRGRPEESASVGAAVSERRPWFPRTLGRGTEDVLAVKECCLFVNCSGSDVLVRLHACPQDALMI